MEVFDKLNKTKDFSDTVPTKEGKFQHVRGKKGKNNVRKNIGGSRIKSNMSRSELKALKSLKKKISEGNITITQTDKSSRFAVMTTDQYLKAGAEHTKKDKLIDWKTVVSLQNKVNSHVWWLMQTIGYSKNKYTKRMLANLIDHGREVPEMILLCKDHKKWDGKGPVPTRPVFSGNKGLNTHLSELLSEILEPVSFSIGGGEIASTEEALSRIEHVNNTVLKHEDLSALNAFEEVLQTDNISQILREECGSINEKW